VSENLDKITRIRVWGVYHHEELGEEGHGSGGEHHGEGG
jgi:hypothetical protein